jgi:hypothetical protein
MIEGKFHDGTPYVAGECIQNEYAGGGRCYIIIGQGDTTTFIVDSAYVDSEEIFSRGPNLEAWSMIAFAKISD